jgi:hypothetical protein
MAKSLIWRARGMLWLRVRQGAAWRSRRQHVADDEIKVRSGQAQGNFFAVGGFFATWRYFWLDEAGGGLKGQ